MARPMDVIADTSFFIDLQRKRSWPVEWISANPKARLVLTPVTYAELLVGQPDESIVHPFIGDGPRLEIDFDVAREFGRLARLLRQKGQLIGPHDLWIASMGLVNDLPVLTRNLSEFSRVPRLRVDTY